MAAHHAHDLRRDRAVAVEPRSQGAVDAEVVQALGNGFRRRWWIAPARGHEVASDPPVECAIRVCGRVALHELVGGVQALPQRVEGVRSRKGRHNAAMMAEMRLNFLGATRTVTGSQYLLETDRARVLIDCGMFQGSPNDVIRNRVPFAYAPNEVDALLLTHAHLDHCGLIPHLSASGFKGSIYATKGSVDLTRLVLLASAQLQEALSQSHQRFAKRNPDRAAVEDEETMAELAAASKEDPAAATRNAAP